MEITKEYANNKNTENSDIQSNSTKSESIISIQ